MGKFNLKFKKRIQKTKKKNQLAEGFFVKYRRPGGKRCVYYTDCPIKAYYFEKFMEHPSQSDAGIMINENIEDPPPLAEEDQPLSIPAGDSWTEGPFPEEECTTILREATDEEKQELASRVV